MNRSLDPEEIKTIQRTRINSHNLRWQLPGFYRRREHWALMMILLLLLPSLVYAGKIADAFSTEIIGVRWGSTQKQVAKAFPKGESRKHFGVLTYTVPDGRTLFETERTLDNNIQFVFNAEGKLNGVNIGFPNGADAFNNLLKKLTTHFGQHELPLKNKSATVVTWPEDNGIKIVLKHLTGLFGKVKIVFSVEYVEANSPNRK
jgi:hypothetical protein